MSEVNQQQPEYAERPSTLVEERQERAASTVGTETEGPAARKLQKSDTAGYGSAVNGFEAHDEDLEEGGSPAQSDATGPSMKEVGSTDRVDNKAAEMLGDAGKEPLGWKGAVVVQLITMIGAGILFYPGIFAELGYVMSLTFLFMAGTASCVFLIIFYHTIQKLKKMHPDYQIKNLEDVGVLCFGEWFRWVGWTIIYGTLFILAISFLIFTGELMNGFVDIAPGEESNNIPVSQFYWSLIFGIPQLLMAWIPDLKILKYVLNLGVVAVIIVIINHIVLCSLAIADDAVGNDPDTTAARAVRDFGPESDLESWKIVLGSWTTFLYGYGALIVSAQILLDMGPNHKQFPKATIVAHICTTSIYLLFGAFGYGAFGTAPPPSFLSPNSLIYDDYRTNWAIGAAFTVTNLTVTIPIFINSLNRGLVLILPKDKQESWPWVYGFRSFVVLAIMALSCTPVSYFDDLTGLIPMCTVAMINVLFPIMYWWACLEHEYALEHDEPKWSCLWKVIKPRMWYFWLHMLVAFVIVIAVIFGFWTSLESLIDNIEGNE